MARNEYLQCVYGTYIRSIRHAYDKPMKTKETKNSHPITMGLPQDFHADCLRQADRNGMSLTALIRNLLRWSVERDVHVTWVDGCPRFREAVVSSVPHLNTAVTSALSGATEVGPIQPALPPISEANQSPSIPLPTSRISSPPALVVPVKASKK